MRKTLASFLLIGLSACNGKSGLVGMASADGPAGRPVTYETPHTNILRSGTLALFGPEQDAWWGLRQAQGGVIRLQLNPQEFNAYRVWQNQPVEIEGVLLPPFLGTPFMRVTHIRNTPQR